MPLRRWLLATAALVPLPVVAAATTFQCSFSSYSDHQAADLHRSTPLIMTFVVNGGRAFMASDRGTVRVVPVAADGAVTFVRLSDPHDVSTITITGDGSAVFSRNRVRSGKLTPRQFYGRCSVH